MPAPTSVPVHPAPLGAAVQGWFTGASAPPTRAPGQAGAPGHPSNLSHRRPHRPDDLARARRDVGVATGTDPDAWHLMQQVHGTRVEVVDEHTPVGAELRACDALVTMQSDRVLAVAVADCVPVLLAGTRAIAAVHAGRVGMADGVIAATLDVLEQVGEDLRDVRAALGPAIGGCCYEVPQTLQEAVITQVPAAAATTSFSTPALDLRAGVTAQLTTAGVREVAQVGGCTRCTPGWFSHRADPDAGRSLGLVVRPSGRPHRGRS